ncbi:MAG: Rpn family recombination-promoting nuclease/putative transposase, partial [Treponema sp.]|nr:Rpn family recombination-promoting nuclease/putative transposase [Treponema sp.]
DPFYTSHGIRLDVYVQDESRIYDVEIQNRDFQDLGRRTRYYQGMMDTDSLLKGEPYSKLKDSIIIFLCRFDPFKKGIPCYTVKRTCLQDSAVKINDGALVQVFNCQAFGQVKNPKLRAFLKYIQTGSVETDFTRRLEKMVEAKKQIEGMKKAYLSWSLHDHDVRMEGRIEGRNEGLIEGRIEGIAIGEKRGRSEGATERAREDARNLLAMHALTHEQIAQAVGLSIAEVEQLAAQG